LEKRRVVITGLGLVTPLGLDVESTWKNILAGKSGAGPVEIFDVTDFPTKISAAVKNFDASPYLSSKDARKLDLFMQYGIAAASQAMQDANLEANEQNAHRIGVALGSGIGGLPTIEKNHQALLEGGARKILPTFIPTAIINMLPGYFSILKGLKGPNISIVTACTSGTHNIGFAARTIAYGDADVMIAGGAEMATCPLGLGGFAAARALSTRNDDPQRASRPWDKERDGFLLGDGAGALVLESYEHAKQRGAKIYAELVGFGMSADAYHMTAPDSEGAGFIASMHNAFQDANLTPADIDYVNAHGTSTPTGDVIEALAIKKAFGSAISKVAISSTKSMIGHLLGAAGAVEAVFSILAMRDQVAPPTINLDNPDVGCEDLNLVPHTAQPTKINAVLSNSFGFGGTNGTVIFKNI